MTASGADVPGPLGAGAQRYGMGASRITRPRAEFCGRPKYSSRAGSFGEVASAFYLPRTDGEIRVDATGEGHSLGGRCIHKGGKTFAIKDRRRTR